MFEKEGIKYALEETIGTECLSKPIEDFSFIDLADEQQEKAQCYKDGAEFGYNKANEWHYVKDGKDLPEEFDKPYLCYVNGHFEVGYFMAYKEQPWHFDEYYLDNEDVIAWKEIVLPKEIKENDNK